MSRCRRTQERSKDVSVIDSYVSPDDFTYSARARALVEIGREAIAKADDAALDRYYADDYVLHGPDGDADLTALKGFFAMMRVALRDFACERLALIEQGDTIAARTVMTGIFDGPMRSTTVGPVQPNGQPVRRELINFFRYDGDGRLAEEWIQYDNLSFLSQLGVNLVAT
jgi:predicted ester cyclase